MKPGQKFKLKDNITPSLLASIGYTHSIIDWAFNQKYFTCIEQPLQYKNLYLENHIWFNHPVIGKCYFLDYMIEPLGPRPSNHPLTNIFK